MNPLLIYGGSFDPPHLGHQGVMAAVKACVEGEAWVVPSFIHPFGKKMASFKDRIKMCELAFGSVVGGGVVCSSIEETLEQPAYTIRLMEALNAMHPGREIFFVLGADAVLSLDQWHRSVELKKIVRFVVVGRPGFTEEISLPDMLTVEAAFDVSSTQVRQRIREGKSINDLVHPDVERYIKAKQLYTS